MESTDLPHFGVWLRDQRRRCGWTQLALARRLGVDVGTVSRWERRVRTEGLPSLLELRDLCRLFAASADEALDLRPAPPRPAARPRAPRAAGGADRQ